jgi:O-antigen chain-terminating methyltransferase
MVQFLNRYTEVAEQRAGRLAELGSTLVRFSQRIDRLVDAKDRLYASLGNTRTDLLLEAMDKRLETMALGLQRGRDRIEGMVSSVQLARAELASLRTPAEPRPSERTREPAIPSPTTGALDAAEYVAFENRFRGSAEDIRERLTPYVAYFKDLPSVLELGCGRGEFLELLRENDIDARGIDDNPEMVAVCKERGLSVAEADIASCLRETPPASLGGIFAAQVIEHLPPDQLREMLVSCYRALREDGRLVVETVNPRSLVALVESFYRDLSHQKPLHPETVDFLLRACGFREVTIHYTSPVHERSKLLSITPNDASARTTNENFRKINAVLFGDQDYAAIAIK